VYNFGKWGCVGASSQLAWQCDWDVIAGTSTDPSVPLKLRTMTGTFTDVGFALWAHPHAYMKNKVGNPRPTAAHGVKAQCHDFEGDKLDGLP